MDSEFHQHETPATNLGIQPLNSLSRSDPLLYDLVQRDSAPREPGYEGSPEKGSRWMWIQKRIDALKQRLPQIDCAPGKQTVTLNIEKDAIRIVVFKGKRVVAWSWSLREKGGSLAERDGAPPASDEKSGDAKSGVSSQVQELLDQLGIQHGGRLWELLDKVGIRRGRVVMDLSLYTTLMRRLRIPKVRGRYLEPVVTSEVLDSIPFEEDEVDLAWQLKRSDEDQSVFAIALPKQRVDSQVGLVREIGLIPSAAYSKAVALALASGVPEAILIHLEPAEAAIVLVHKGEPQVVHQLEFGKEEVTPEERARTLARAADQVAGYYQPFDPEEESEALPVVLTGQNYQVNPVVSSLQDILGRQALPPAPPLQYPPDFPLEEYATNVGLFLADQVRARKPRLDFGGNAHALNLLPARHRPRPLPVLQASIFLTLLLLAIHPANVTDWVEVKFQEKQATSQELQRLRARESNYDHLLANHSENEAALEGFTGQVQKLESRLDALQTEKDLLLARLLTMTSDALPPGATIASVSPQGDAYSLIGSASSYAEALQYVANLKTYAIFGDARASRIEGSGGTNPEGGEGRINFQVRVSLPKEPAPEATPPPN